MFLYSLKCISYSYRMSIVSYSYHLYHIISYHSYHTYFMSMESIAFIERSTSKSLSYLKKLSSIPWHIRDWILQRSFSLFLSILSCLLIICLVFSRHLSLIFSVFFILCLCHLFCRLFLHNSVMFDFDVPNTYLKLWVASFADNHEFSFLAIKINPLCKCFVLSVTALSNLFLIFFFCCFPSVQCHPHAVFF